MKVMPFGGWMVLVLLAGLVGSRSASAAFPDPYCLRDYADAVQPITDVKIAGIDHASPAAVDGTPADEDFTAIVGQLAPGGRYRLDVQGNTDGHVSAAIAAYFDWNQDGSFGTGERYFVGTLVGSTGSDGQTASMGITVPTTAKLGPTRMRITKQYTQAGAPGTADAPACGASGAGQAEDYTVDLDPLAPVPPLLTLAIAPASAQVGAPVILDFTIDNTSASAANLTADFTTVLPAGMSLATPALAFSSCEGTFLASDGSDQIALAAASAIPPGGCSIRARVLAATGGSYRVVAGTLATDQGDAAPVSARFLATDGGSTIAYQTGFEPPFTSGPLDQQQGWDARGFDVTTVQPANGTQHVRALALAAPTDTTRPIAIAPGFAADASRFVSLTATLRLSADGAGASWRLSPLDPATGRTIAIVQFARGAPRAIQVVDFGQGIFVDTGAQWPADTDFDFRLIVDRVTGGLTLCRDGAAIYTHAAGGSTAGYDITSLSLAQSIDSGQTAGNTLDVDDIAVEYSPYGGCDGLPATYHVTASVGSGVGSVAPSGLQVFNEGDTPSFTLSPAAGLVTAEVSGSCSGFLIGNVYTTYPLQQDCILIANFATPDSLFCNGFEDGQGNSCQVTPFNRVGDAP